MKVSKIALALGGGGVRGLSHAGVLEVLEREQVPVHLIVGTSFGSVVGGMYATRPASSELQKRLLEFLEDPLFRRTRTDILRGSMAEGKKIRLLHQLKGYARRGVLYGLSFSRGYFISGTEFRKTLGRLLDDIDMDQTQIPFRCVATDLLRGEAVTIGEGSLIRAVQASCSLPGVFQPVEVEDALFVDGGWSGPVPVPQARDAGADRVIAVDASADGEFAARGASGLQILTRSQDITKQVLSLWMTRGADVVIHPRVGHIHWTQFNLSAECIARGREAAEKALPAIRAMLKG